MQTRTKRPVIDISNQVFGSLTAIRFSHKDSIGNAYWEYSCKCGKSHTARANTIKYQAKKYNNSIEPSCGCINLSKVIKHGYRSQGTKHPLYGVYNGMMTRCYDENSPNYKWYGALGVTVCEEWKSNPIAFIQWAEQTNWIKGLHIDKDILCEELGIVPHVYSPNTCQFVTAKINVGFATNRDNFGIHPNVKLSHQDVIEIKYLYSHGYTGVEIADMYSVNSSSIYAVLRG